MTISRFVFLSVALLGGSTGCASTLSPPFNAMKGQAMTVYKLQNVDLPAPQPLGTISQGLQLPPVVQQWIAAGASALPPGILQPLLQGLIPGSAPAPQPPDAVRFHGFRILGYQEIADASVKSDIQDLFGHSSNFTNLSQTCMYPEFGFAMAQPNGPTADVLVSLSCQQVQAYNIQWPYPQTGLTPGGESKIVAIVKRVFGSS